MTQPKFIERLISFFSPTPTPQKIAKQLRQPSGKLGREIGIRMNKSNVFLYDFLLEKMEIEDHQAILEIGFGNGMFFNRLFSKAENLRVSGIDFSETMVNEAEKSNKEAIDSGILDLWFGDCEVLPFDNNQFDKVFCINVVYFWENPIDNLLEIHRVLKPGGKFYSCIRDKESMKHMPFTQFGFIMYDVEGWKNQLVKNLFKFLDLFIVEEPPVEFSGDSFTPKSLCFIAQKPE